MYTLRPYQQDSVKATIHHFRKHTAPAVLTLSTGAGKSLIIAELARIARGRVLVLAHVKELVEQNHQKYESYGLKASIFSAGLGRKETNQKVVFASVQSMVNNLDKFANEFTLLVIDECHRVPEDENSSYRRVIKHLQEINPGIKILGLTATPYRLGIGWIYKYHTRGQVRTDQERFFRDCIFEVPTRYLMDENYLTEPKILDMAVIGYDFSSLKPAANGRYREQDLDSVINKSNRATPMIIEQVIAYSKDRLGVMIFASTVNHAKEIMGYLANENAALIIGDTPIDERDRIINDYKDRKIKFLVNVSVLTTGFDAPHVDLIAILRPTESISLYQQIVGRGLRLFDGKKDCLIMEFAGNCYDLYQPEIGSPKPTSDSEVITVPCPACGFKNNFWGKIDPAGFLIEHYGRRCQGYFEDEEGEREECGYRFRAKYCEDCGADNDIAARRCNICDAVMVDPDKKLRDALKLKNAIIVHCTDLRLEPGKNKFGKPQLKVIYITDENSEFSEIWPLSTKIQKDDFLKKFINPHLVDRHRPFTSTAPTKVSNNEHRFRPPEVIIAQKNGRFWTIRDKLFDLDQYKKKL
ncbi:ATP-dependent helicase [Vibrio parahaemolyticus]|uniref:DEAD/DEAH box helicase n=1 Tax=Vibrio parahaemolyticus TaxID=670 RepID=UPI0011206DE0|nr:DEAD/DEAH box helicase [Vibrio parahaemolyticus]TOQ81091.1 ATP-dependent helicase [Vibrio parahaemolyticus]